MKKNKKFTGFKQREIDDYKQQVLSNQLKMDDYQLKIMNLIRIFF
jgi:hypothetical protein